MGTSGPPSYCTNTSESREPFQTLATRNTPAARSSSVMMLVSGKSWMPTGVMAERVAGSDSSQPMRLSYQPVKLRERIESDICRSSALPVALNVSR